MKLSSIVIAVILTGIFSIPSKSFGGIIADLSSDWSDTSNPNLAAHGVWAYREGTNALPLVNNWTPLGAVSTQPAWAPSSGEADFIPAIFRSTTDIFDWQTGDIVVHSSDPGSGPSSSTANIAWTSTFNTIVNLDGNAWMGRDIGRGNDWTLLLNGNILSYGHLESGDAFSRANPFSFQDGSGGSIALSNLSVSAGDVVELQIARTSADGDFVGVNLSVTAVPEPSAFAILTISAVGILSFVQVPFSYRGLASQRNHTPQDRAQIGRTAPKDGLRGFGGQKVLRPS
ncbi:hypothetical protein [Novipirellula artificiosorum]|uniref:PEP-CTERM protein-sorting domain-containing protein n=1 Tax=Novipirellula artificiosorum TaxID=2528016 RepID=A0A5C6DWS5_9BACT|nr:hypothetical protein [Novipirellula artificiosorum]TWU40845.1 hypothetical protein Poly41_16800 [Novipirellula artificiosorum]